MLSRFTGQYDQGMFPWNRPLWLAGRPFAPTVLTALVIVAGLLALERSAGSAAAQNATAATGRRIVAIGDVHGAFDQMVGILQAAGLIDGSQRWSGGNAILVQTGDVFDRGPGVRPALDLLMRLEDEAKRAGGRVESLLGNHEMMNLLAEFRDVSAETYATFADQRSEDRRKRAYSDYARIASRQGKRREAVKTRDEWMAAHPAGYVEYVEALGPRGVYGRWLRSHQVLVTIDGSVFMHAGVQAGQAADLDAINKTAAAEVRAWDDTRAAMVQAQLVPPFCTLAEAGEAAAAEVERISAAIKAEAPIGDHVTREFVDKLQSLFQVGKTSLLDAEGPLWFRGFATWPDSDEPKVAALVERLGIQRFVTGHTPSSPGRIRARFGNRVFLIDTGMLTSFFKSGRPSALEIQGGRITAIYGDAREVLVGEGAGGKGPESRLLRSPGR